MKNLKLWQKAGLVAAIVGGLTLGGFTPKYDSKGLESKLPSISMSTAEAKETNPQGYEVPRIVGDPINSKKYTEDGVAYIAELFGTADGGQAIRYRVGDKIFAYGIDHDKVDPGDYCIVDRDGKKDASGNQTFEDKYRIDEYFPIPDWVK